MARTSGFSHLLAPIVVGGMELRNRVVMTTHGPRLSPGRYLRYLEERCAEVALVGLPAGVGLGPVPPGPGRYQPTYGDDPDAFVPHPLSSEGRARADRFIPILARQADVVHAGGARCVGQLHHGGIATSNPPQQPVVGPSDVVDEHRRHTPHLLTVGELEDTVEAYALAAARVVAAGCDGVEVHAAHGYLLQQFLSPVTNRRSDAYGGSATGRLRLLAEVVAAIRAQVGPEVPVGVRLPGREEASGGLSPGDVAVIGEQLAAAGVAYLSISGGTYTGLHQGDGGWGQPLGPAYVAPGGRAGGDNLAAAAIVRARAGVPVVATGRMVDPEVAEAALAEGRADLIGMTRALIADPRWVAKVRGGRAGSINACVGCNECHTGAAVACPVNPAAGREEELALRPPSRRRHVVVVGAGPAGLGVAAGAAQRGHQVTVVEGAENLGGIFAAWSRDPERPRLAAFLADLEAGARVPGVQIHTGLQAGPSDVLALDPDVVVLATGTRERTPAGPGLDDERVCSALDVWHGRAQAPGHTVVVGGLEDHLPPLTTARLLAARGHRVTMVTELISPGAAVETATQLALLRQLVQWGVELRPLERVRGLDGTHLRTEHTLTGRPGAIADVDRVVLAWGRKPWAPLAEPVAAAGVEVHLVGDCLAPRRLVQVMIDAARAAATL